MDVRHFITPDGYCLRVSSHEQLDKDDLEAVLSHIRNMSPADMAMEGEITLQLSSEIP